MFCQCFPADTDAEAAADAAIARFAEVCPELPDRIVDRLALGPRELEARFGITGGHIFHGEMLGDQLLDVASGRAASAESTASISPAPAPTPAARSRAHRGTSRRRPC